MGQAVTWLLARWEQRGCGVATALVLAAVWGAAGAQPVAPAGAASAAGEGAAPAAPVYTRARLVSVEMDASGNAMLVRLKLLPRAKLPFTTQTFRVVNPALLYGISQGGLGAVHCPAHRRRKHAHVHPRHGGVQAVGAL